MSKQNTATTAHGDVEYETVACSSCGTEVMKSDARRFVVGDLKGTECWSHKNQKEYHFNSRDYAAGWACQYCVDESVVGFPTLSKTKRVWRSLPEPVRFLLIAFGLVVLTVAIVTPFEVMFG